MIERKSKITLPLYNYRIYVIFTDDLVGSATKLVKEGKLATNHGVDNTVDGFHVRLQTNYSYIVLRYKARMNDIVHESYHAIATLLRWIGAEHEEELFAYHLGYVVQCAVDDQKKALKKK